MPALYATLTSTLVITVAVVASVVRPATPPSIAELGPAPQERIEQARQDQAADTAPGATGPNGADGQGPGPPTATPSGPEAPTVAPPAPSEVEVPATRRCFGDPPRQTEDPHSPPCVFEIFTGDNGGATAPGVTATEIRLTISVNPGDTVSGPIVEALVNHFNRRYEFYGRRLSPEVVTLNGDQSDPADLRAHAEDLIAAKPFGAVTFFSAAASAVTLYRPLAHAGIVSAVSAAPAFDSDAVTDGMTWLVGPPLDVRLRAGARLVCGALTGRPASHAGADVQATTTSRRFAIVVLSWPGSRPDPEPLQNGLNDCGADAETFDVPWATQEEYEPLMLQLKAEGFTTVLVVSSSFNLALPQAATNVGYFPEWLDLGVIGSHREFTWAGPGRAFTGGHGDHAFGFTPNVRERPAADVPAMWAYQEGGGPGGHAIPTVNGRYQSLLVLASGIQGAGPNLTPETFAQALRTMTFPNPNPGGPPYWQQRVGFGPGDPVFHDDYALWWWNEDAPSQTSDSSSGRGSFCYLDRGGRFTAESFPDDADTRLFNPEEPCR